MATISAPAISNGYSVWCWPWKTDRPSEALVADLKQRGLLDSTLVAWGGEMGRLPVVQNDAGAAKVGRDHNTYGFTWWFAGGGFKLRQK